jgi:eukaryotic-like serine/threonine-protein kinase
MGGVRTPVPLPGPPPGPAGAPAHNATAVMQIPQFPPGQSGPGGGPLGGGAPFGGPPTHPGQTMTVGMHRHDRTDESPLVNRILSAVTGRFVLIGIGVLAVAVLAWAIWYQTSGQYRTVPSVIGESVTEAKAELTSKGYKVVQGPSRFSDKIAKDAVVDMQPSPGSQATSGALITLFASRGMQPVSIPDLKGKSVADAQNALQSLGLKFTNASEASKSVAPGSVTRTVPAAGQQAQPGVDTVTIYASSGVQVPNVVGQSQEQAKQTLQAAGFQVAINEQDPAPGQQPDIVLAQSPQQGSSAGAGALITLTATKHAPPQPGQPVAVPSVLGMNFAQAVAALQAAGLPVKHPDKPFDGPVTGQNPPPGTQVPAGTPIDIWSGDQHGN